MMNISVHGHASSSVYTYTKNGTYNEKSIPDDALMLALMCFQHDGNIDSDDYPDAFQHALAHTGNYRSNYYSMRVYAEKDEQVGYTISRYLGYRKGKLDNDVFTVFPEKPDEPIDLIVWDAGLGGLQIPDNCRSSFLGI